MTATPARPPGAGPGTGPETRSAPRTAARRAGRPALTALAVLTALVTAATAACDGDREATPELAVHGAYVPEPVPDRPAAGFLTIDNTGDADDVLTGATSPVAGSVEIHETVDGTMRAVDALPVPADGRLRLSRGGTHLMLLDLTRRLTEGDTIRLTLHFEHSDPVELRVPVRSATHTGEE